MKKQNIDLVIIKIKSNGKEAINLKIYKDGKIFRRGNGFLPELKLGCMCYTKNSRYFETLIKNAPDHVFNNPINYEEETPNGALEYFMGFYNEQKNAESHHDKKATGIRFLLDQRTRYNHPALGLIDGLAIKAIEITNSLYFDIYMQVVFNARSSGLPEKNVLIGPNEAEEIQKDYKNYIKQIIQNKRGWCFEDFIKNKTYQIDGIDSKAILINTSNSFSIRFLPFSTNS